MKQYFLILSLLLLAIPDANAQSIFNQQATKRRIIVEQIAGIELYATALKKGYDLTQKGLATAHDLKNGTFSLHSDYLQSLSAVSGPVQTSPKAKEIIVLQQKIVTVFTAEIKWQQSKKLLSANELDYLKKVYDNLLVETKNDLKELALVTTPGQLQLTDAQRLEWIDKLYVTMQDKYNFTCSYTGRTRKLANARLQDNQENQHLKQLYGIQ